jgi:hypothetical protein
MLNGTDAAVAANAANSPNAMTNSLVAISLLKPNQLAVLWISILTLPKYLTFPFKKSGSKNKHFAHGFF